MLTKLSRHLSGVRRPARYTGGEVGAVIKDKHDIDLRVAFCFPDTYEIGMSCLGLRILYDLINRQPGIWCERAFAPWDDMRQVLIRTKTPLYALESGDGLCGFDVLAFTLQYEMSYTNVLSMLDLAGIPLRADNRGERHPIVIAGGPCTFNPEPLADFIDLFVIGEGEEVIIELLGCIRTWKKSGDSKAALLTDVCRIPGVYVPSLYNVSYGKDGLITEITPLHGTPETVDKRIIKDFDSVCVPERPIVPNIEIVHDRAALELFRGCIRGCRFCQAGFTSRPVREKSPQTLCRQAKSVIENSGCSEIGLVSLSTSDYTYLRPLCDSILEWCEPMRVSLSLPSLRADSFSKELLNKVQKVRKSGLTFAPEAGTPRMRDVINKNLTEKDLMDALQTAFLGGWNGVKLYFMIGLPTETDEDVREIGELCNRVYYMWRQSRQDKGRSVRISSGASCFVPKPHTPFQWEPMDSVQALRRKAGLVKDTVRKQITFRWHDPLTSYIEAVFARGDRRLGKVLEQAYRLGCRMDGWSEFFSSERWMEAFRLEGLDPDFYALRRRDFDEILPWAHISCGVSREYLQNECRRAYAAQPTPDCRSECSGCGLGSNGRCLNVTP
ncbi:MAG: TIGR03960 family B12-binding radical SAM protein [Oscillospiraceae bacterium]|nr:TIGR03960 family B12-binding radical SAM protein [Oscillospiraceae bacterium]